MSASTNYLIITKKEKYILFLAALSYWVWFQSVALNFGYPLGYALYSQTVYIILDIGSFWLVYVWICPSIEDSKLQILFKHVALWFVYFAAYRGLNAIVPEYNEGNYQIVTYPLVEDAVDAFISLVIVSIPAYALYYYKYSLYQVVQLNDRKLHIARQREELMQRELEFFKGEFNAHFTFNILTYLHSKAIHNPPLAESILLLNDILRYNSEVISNKFIALNTEIAYLQNFIELTKLIHPNFHIQLLIQGETENFYIFPRIIISFVENAIKHGKANDPVNPILITIRVHQWPEIEISVINQKRDIPVMNSTNKGIAITRKILQNVYKDHHSLNVCEEDSMFKVDLKIYSQIPSLLLHTT